MRRLRSNRASIAAAGCVKMIVAPMVRTSCRIGTPFYAIRYFTPKPFTQPPRGEASDGVFYLESMAASRVFRITIEQLDGDSLRPAQKANLDARTRHVRWLGELDALGLKFRRDTVDVTHR